MQAEYRELTIEDKECLIRTRNTLRRIRHAGIVADSQKTNVLIDAENLGQAAVSSIIKSVHSGPSNQRAVWLKKLESMEAKYAGYDEYSRQKLSGKEFSIRVNRFIYQTALDCQDSYNRFFLGGNGYERLGPDSIYNESLGFISPLSTDYLYALIVQTYFRRYITPRGFQLKPAILSTDGEFAMLPKNFDGKGCFDRLRQVAVAVDSNFIGITRKGLNAAVLSAYPQTTIVDKAIPYMEEKEASRFNVFIPV